MNRKIKKLSLILLGLMLVTSCGKNDSQSTNTGTSETETTNEGLEATEVAGDWNATNKVDWNELDLSDVKKMSNKKLAEELSNLVGKACYGENMYITNTPVLAQLVANVVKNQDHLDIISQGGIYEEEPCTVAMGKGITVSIKGYPLPQSAYGECYEIDYECWYGEEHKITISIYAKEKAHDKEEKLIKSYEWSN